MTNKVAFNRKLSDIQENFDSMEERVANIEQRLREISRDFQVEIDHIITRIINCDIGNELVDKQFE